MRIKILNDTNTEVLGKDNPWELKAGTILEVEDIESHENDENTVDIHLEDGTILMYIPVTCFEELP